MATFNELRDILLGTGHTGRVPGAEFFVDESIRKRYCEEVLGRSWVGRDEELRSYHGFPPIESWVNGHAGLIRSRRDFERFPWKKIEPDLREHEMLPRLLPQDMQIVVETGSFQDLLDVFVGYESLFLMIYDDPCLLGDVIERWVAFKKRFYGAMVAEPRVGAIWHADDLGSKSGLLFSPEFLRNSVIPWYRDYSKIAHNAGKMLWFHYCGNIYKDRIIKDLIYDVGIDAFHSFQDSILPVQDFLRRYGDDVAIIGGIDVDVVCTAAIPALRNYVTTDPEEATPNRRYAVGIGNSVIDYVPFESWVEVPEIVGGDR